MNPYEKKKHRGVRGSVPRNFESVKIYDRSGESIVIFIGKLDKDSYDYGFEIYLPDGSHIKKIPGQGQGWFDNRLDAHLYAAYALKIGFSQRMNRAALAAINAHISEISMPKLDLG